MRIEILRAIAAAAAPPADGAYRAYFSKTANGWNTVTGTPGGFFDHAANAHVSRTGAGFFHHGPQTHVRLEVEGSQFRGFDHGSNRHFAGTVQGANIVIRDTASGHNHLYTFRIEEG